MNKKKWYQSWTLWVNGLSLIAMAVQTAPEVGFAIDPQLQGTILAGINILLRLKTDQGIAATEK